MFSSRSYRLHGLRTFRSRSEAGSAGKPTQVDVTAFAVAVWDHYLLGQEAFVGAQPTAAAATQTALHLQVRGNYHTCIYVKFE